jgi:formylglycine-generating enzyme required for sulfatase activity
VADDVEKLMEAHLRTLALCHAAPTTVSRPAYWLRGAGAVGARLPLCLAWDLGALLTRPDLRIARPEHLPADVETGGYEDFLTRLAARPLVREVSTWDLSDGVMGVLLARLVEDVEVPATYALPPEPHAHTFARRLAVELDRADAAQIWREADPAERPELRRLLPPEALASVETNLRGLDADEVRFLHRYGPRFAGAPDPRELLDLFNLLGLPSGARMALSQVLRLLPRVSEVTRTGGAQTYAMGGYAGLTRRGSLDNLVPTELAYPQAMFLHRLLNRQALYYGRETERERRRELVYVVTQTGLGLLGDGDVLARALTLALAQVMARRGYEVQQSFVGSAWTPPRELDKPGQVQRLLYYRDEGWLQTEEMLEAVLGQLRGWGDRYRGMQVLWVVGEHWDADGWEAHEGLYRALRQRAGQQAWFVRTGVGSKEYEVRSRDYGVKGRDNGDGKYGGRQRPTAYSLLPTPASSPAASSCFDRYQVVESEVLWEEREPPPRIHLPAKSVVPRRAWERLRDEIEDVGFRDGVRDVLHFVDEETQLEAWWQLAEITEDPDQAAIDDYLRDLTPVDMVYVPAGPFLMGTTEEEVEALVTEFSEGHRDEFEREVPQHEVELPGYYIGRYPVTNEAYAEFIAAGGYEMREYWTEVGWARKERDGWTEPRYWNNENRNQPRQPVVGVSWYEAVAYCRWRGLRLPTEAEWEKAAGWDPQAGRKRKYPWGDEADESKYVYNPSSWPEVGAISPGDENGYGVHDMAGLYTWCSTRRMEYPYDAEDGREDPSGSAVRVLRGSGSEQRWARCAFRSWVYPGFGGYGWGLRVSAPRRLLPPGSES